MKKLKSITRVIGMHTRRLRMLSAQRPRTWDWLAYFLIALILMPSYFMLLNSFDNDNIASLLGVVVVLGVTFLVHLMLSGGRFSAIYRRGSQTVIENATGYMESIEGSKNSNFDRLQNRWYHRCPTCRKACPYQVKRCHHCGTLLATLKELIIVPVYPSARRDQLCKKCGTKNDFLEESCENCGKRRSEEQIVEILREAKRSDLSVPEICRKYEIVGKGKC